MNETPDLGKIVSLIMENPDLITKIQGLAKGEETKEAPKPQKVEAEVAAPVEASRPAAIDTKEKRNRLLCAMKPYLSSERAKALDSVMSVAEILDMMKPR